MNSTVILGALELGGIFAVLSLGLYISFKVLNIPDLTVDGSWICSRCDCRNGDRFTHY